MEMPPTNSSSLSMGTIANVRMPATSTAVIVNGWRSRDRKSTRLNSSHTEIYTLSLHDALPIYGDATDELILLEHGHDCQCADAGDVDCGNSQWMAVERSEEHTSELQSHRDLHSFPTRRSSDLWRCHRRTHPP